MHQSFKQWATAQASSCMPMTTIWHVCACCVSQIVRHLHRPNHTIVVSPRVWFCCRWHVSTRSGQVKVGEQQLHSISVAEWSQTCIEMHSLQLTARAAASHSSISRTVHSSANCACAVMQIVRLWVCSAATQQQGCGHHRLCVHSLVSSRSNRK